jgi:hypothetical protein
LPPVFLVTLSLIRSPQWALLILWPKNPVPLLNKLLTYIVPYSLCLVPFLLSFHRLQVKPSVLIFIIYSLPFSL